MDRVPEDFESLPVNPRPGTAQPGHGGLPAGSEANAALQASACLAMRHAARLAQWAVEQRCAVTPSGALRPAEVPRAAHQLGVTGLRKVRRAADVEVLHQAWTVAWECGLVSAASGVAVAGPRASSWPGADDAEVLATWWTAFRAVCLGRSPRDLPELVLWSSMVALEALDAEATAEVEQVPLLHRVHGIVLHDDFLGHKLSGGSSYSEWLVSRRGGQPWPLFGVLEAFGTLTGQPGEPRVTELGRWVRSRMRAEVPESVRADWSARTLLDHVADQDNSVGLWRVARRWLAARSPLEAARSLLVAAEDAGAAHRVVAITLVDLLGDDVEPVWEEMAGAPRMGPHLRALMAWSRLPEGQMDLEGVLDPEDEQWLAMEQIVAGLAVGGPDEVLCRVIDRSPGLGPREAVEWVRDSGHPEAEVLAEQLARFVDSGQPRSVDQVVQLKVSLAGWRPPVWRRVQVPAAKTLGDLHQVIQVLFGWDGDHLHLFEHGTAQYTNTFFSLDDCSDEDLLRLRDVARSGSKLTYTYDLGASWEHEIVVERVLPQVAGQSYPTCLAFSGDNPVEYPTWDDEADEETDEVCPFDLEAVNAELQRLLATGE